MQNQNNDKKSKYEMKKKISADRCENTSSSQKNEKRSTITKKNLCIEYLLLQRFSQMIYIKFNKVKQKKNYIEK